MDSERYESAKRLFLEALREPEAARGDFVARAAPDPTLRDDVLGLLRHHAAGESGGEPTGPLQLPERIGPYRILGVVGRGGMGIVYRAQRGDEPPVALKVLEVGIFSARVLSRFRREAEALRRLDHPGIARFLEAGELETTLGSQPYYAMELVEGRSLDQLVTPGGLPLARVLHLAIPLAGALVLQQQGQMAYLWGAARVEAQQNARLALDLMTRELRSALSLTTVGTCNNGVTGTNVITFRDSSNKVVTYTLVGDVAPFTLQRTYDGAASDLIGGVSTFQVFCYNADGYTLDANVSTISSVKVVIQTQGADAGNSGAPSSQRARLESRVRLRNL